MRSSPGTSRSTRTPTIRCTRPGWPAGGCAARCAPSPTATTPTQRSASATSCSGMPACWAPCAISRCCGRGWPRRWPNLPPELVVGPGGAAHRRSARRANCRPPREPNCSPPCRRAVRPAAGRVVEWRDDPPFTVAAGRPAATLARPVAARRARSSHKRLDQATSADRHRHRDAPGPQGRQAGPLRDRGRAGGGESGRRAQRLQDLLGEFQDSVVAAEVITASWPTRPAPPARTRSPTACCSPISGPGPTPLANRRASA